MLQKILVEGRKNKVLNPQTAKYILARLPSYFIFERLIRHIFIIIIISKDKNYYEPWFSQFRSWQPRSKHFAYNKSRFMSKDHSRE